MQKYRESSREMRESGGGDNVFLLHRNVAWKWNGPISFISNFREDKDKETENCKIYLTQWNVFLSRYIQITSHSKECN